ncbi:hypothetical protein BRW65_23915 [Mycobacterium paraffinicum]|uniref:Vegetative cell wall protein n=2 Tax=Mycobacterium paraffinicum TaxID=53378 RepID=A0A1Q4HNI9_9MYCO|nr:hypothetical protein BRW65_23915 [Mycobacterium paraffinicum]
MTARQRLRRATRESLAMPAFSSPIDCTPWVIGGLWPTELSTTTVENAALAEYLKADLQRIADGANEQLKMIKRAGLADLPRQAEEARVIDEARGRAVRRVESTMRQLHAAKSGVSAGYPRRQLAEPPSPDMEQTRIIPAVSGARPSEAPTRTARKPRWRVDRPPPAVPHPDALERGRQHETPAREIAAEVATAPEPPDTEATHVIPSVTGMEHVIEAPAEGVEPDRQSAPEDPPQVEALEPAPDQAAPEWTPDADAAVTAIEETQIIPAITEVEPVAHEPVERAPAADWELPPLLDDPGRHQFDEDEAEPGSTEETQALPALTEVGPVVDQPAGAASAADWEPVGNGRHHVDLEVPERASDEVRPAREPEPAAAATSIEETQVIPAITEPEPVADDTMDSGRHHVVVDEPVAAHDEPQPPRGVPGRPPEKDVITTGFDLDRLNRFLEFVVRQEPRLNWAVGDLPDGTTVLVTDLAHGWIPAGINLPAGVRLLEPERRTGRIATLIGDAARVVTYAPGDSLHRSADFATTKSSVEPRELPPIEGLGEVLSQTTRRFDGLPRIVQRLADAAATEAVIIDQEVDVLRVHLDTARYQLLVQYPSVNPTLLLKCLLMAATEGIASGDSISANYHLAWYQKLAAQTPAA